MDEGAFIYVPSVNIQLILVATLVLSDPALLPREGQEAVHL